MDDGIEREWEREEEQKKTHFIHKNALKVRIEWKTVCEQ